MFTLENDQLVPGEIARSMWSAEQMHGVAVSGALARGLETKLAEIGRTDLIPARYTVDLFQPAKMAPCTVVTEVIREGRRLALIDAALMQGDVRVARASCIFLLPTENAGGEVWTAEDHPVPPPLDVAPVSDEPRVPFFSSDADWSQSFPEHQNAGRKQTWQVGLPVVAGRGRYAVPVRRGHRRRHEHGRQLGHRGRSVHQHRHHPRARPQAGHRWRSGCRRPTASRSTASPSARSRSSTAPVRSAPPW